MSVSTQFRDVKFDFTDSCNCCWKRRPTQATQVYVNRHGEVRRFELRRGDSVDIAQAHAMENLQNHLQEICDHFHVNTHYVIDKLRERAGIDLRTPAPLTLGTVRKIESVATEILNSPDTP